MKLTQKDKNTINTCIESIINSQFYFNKNFGIVEFCNILKSTTKIDIISIDNLSIVWQPNYAKNGYYKSYDITFITNDKINVVIDVNENYDFTQITSSCIY